LKTTGKPTAKKTKAKPQQPEALVTEAKAKQAMPADPLSPANLKSMGIRLGIPLVIAWAIAIFLNGWIPKAIVGALTLALAGIALWAVRFAKRTRAVASIVQQADTAEARKEAIAKLETDFKKDDTAAVFAKAQLQIQEDPREALKTLETINLDKVMKPIADEARAQRAMIHLMFGELDEARRLCDAIDLAQHKEAKSRATIAAIVGEAWARSGQAKRAVELLETFDLNDESYADLVPQHLRARAFAYAWASNTKQMKQTLRRLAQLNPQYLGGFITKKKIPQGVSPRGVHPILEKEAFDIFARASGVPRKMEYRRH